MNTTSTSLDAATRLEIITQLEHDLQAHYVFPDVAKDMVNAIKQHQNDGDYDGIAESEAFAKRLTQDLRSVSHDKHLAVHYHTHEIPVRNDETPDNSWWIQDAEAYNYGFVKVERLAGNIGYLEFRIFYPTDIAGDVAVAAMNFLANTQAMIVDLRKNGGGDPTMIALLCSYFFPSEPVHLNSLYWRKSDSMQQFWTLPYVPGKRYGNKPVYVLTSHDTFSGAEEFTYNLKNLKRATIIGETTGGGAHPGDVYRLHTHFEAFIPNGRAINPITNTNWEGTGVTPDIEMPQEEALQHAHKLALKYVQEHLGELSIPLQRTLAPEIQRALEENK